MSHYTVAVIHGENDSVESLLDPFWELDLSSFEAKTDYRAKFNVSAKAKDIKKYCNGIVDDLKKSDKEDELIKKYEGYIKNGEFEELLKDWEGGCKGPSGDWGYYHNPNAKWDWFQIGGRWKDMIKLKSGVKKNESMQGEKSWCNKDEEEDENYADSVHFDDIDFEGMEKEDREKKEKTWKESREFIKELKEKGKNGKELKQEFMNKYGYFSVGMKGLTQSKKDFIGEVFGFGTYAILCDGKWYEAGEMGWWGMSSGTDEEKKKFKNSYGKLFKKLAKGKFISIVDCHI